MLNPRLETEIARPPACISVSPARVVPDIIDDAREGLLFPPRSLPPKYFYDEKGSQLFTRICETDEYYPTRTEDGLLARNAEDIIAISRPVQIIELGSGNSRKTRRLFNACEQIDHTCSYAPFDVCAPMLEDTAGQLQTEYEWLKVTPLLGDYHAGLDHLPGFNERRLFVFLGSTIGNFEPAEARAFIREITDAMAPGDFLLLGIDRVKDVQVLNDAYNDSGGITAAFNLNLLNVLNRELDADFDLNHFNHHASYQSRHSRIEMKLVCDTLHEIQLKKIDEVIELYPGDEILTELSHKFTYGQAEELLSDCGLDIVSHYEPENRYFSVILARF